MSSEHVEVLERLRGVLEHGKMGDKCLIAPDLVTAAIAALSAPPPPAEAQPVAWQYQDREGNWHGFVNEQHRLNTIEDGSWPIRALYAHPPPSAPVGVEGLVVKWKKESESLDIHPAGLAARRVCAIELEQALAQQPAAVDEADAGGAEIEALRAEVAAWEGLHASEVQLRQRWQARAERLEEALRSLLGGVDDLTSYMAEDDEIGYRPCCSVLSYKEHTDDCAITQARAALRDHDQEVSNG